MNEIKAFDEDGRLTIHGAKLTIKLKYPNFKHQHASQLFAIAYSLLNLGKVTKEQVEVAVAQVNLEYAMFFEKFEANRATP